MRNSVPDWIKRVGRPLKSSWELLTLTGAIWHLGPTKVSGFGGWLRRGFAPPAPQIVKWSILRRLGGDVTWIESGTYTGQTTRYLSSFSKYVFSIEPSPELAKKAIRNFSAVDNINIIEGLSENELHRLLGELTPLQKADVSFWLDGHYSAGITFQGPSDTPIVEELLAISEHLPSLKKVTILIDDVRCFDPSKSEYASYPPLSHLSNWADSHNLYWTIENDIFIASNRR